jgi:hypothetical protein
VSALVFSGIDFVVVVEMIGRCMHACVCVCFALFFGDDEKLQSIVHLKPEVTPCLKIIIPSESLLGSKNKTYTHTVGNQSFVVLFIHGGVPNPSHNIAFVSARLVVSFLAFLLTLLVFYYFRSCFCRLLPPKITFSDLGRPFLDRSIVLGLPQYILDQQTTTSLSVHFYSVIPT